MKVAKLVEVSLLVRIIVDENATEDQIIEATYPKLQDKLDNREIGDNVMSIEDDEEVPFGEAPSDLQPRMHIGNDDFCSSCGDNITGEQHTCLKEGTDVIYDGRVDRILTLGNTQVELEENGWVNKSEIKRK